MPTILLTGATGFVGRQIHRSLCERGYSVKVVARPGSIGRLAVPVAERNIVQSEDMFAEDADWWAKACSGMETVIHAAWYVAHGRYPDAPQNADCLRGSIALAQGAVRAGIEHVVSIGTCAEYRWPGDRLSIDAPLDPRNFYATCKLAAFQVLSEWFAQHKVSFSWARLFFLYGEGEHPDRLAAYLHGRLKAGQAAELSAGTQVRDFLDVAVAGSMIADLVRSRQAGPVNICSGKGMTIRAFAEGIADRYGRRDLLSFCSRPAQSSEIDAIVGVCNLDEMQGGRA